MPAPLVMRGTVTKMKDRKPSVEIPDLGVGYDFGPCETATGQLLKRGDRVLCVSVGGIPEDIVVIAKLDAEDDELRMEARFDARYYRRHLVDAMIEALEQADAQLRTDFMAADAALEAAVAAVESALAGKADAGHTH